MLTSACAAVLWYSWPRESDRPDFQATQWIGSDACEDCHQNRHQSWHKTYHRTMTQEASAASVQGVFDGRELRYEGGLVRPTQRDGRYYFDYFDPSSGNPLSSIAVERTVGSHVYQQYLGKFDGNYYRLHYLWHNKDQRWVHMNGAFLHSDGKAFDSQIALWNQNCIFCHNTGPQPGVQNLQEMQQKMARGEAVDVARDAQYQSHVAELGISCEACHSPAGRHAELNRNPVRRWLLALTGIADASIVHPQKIDAEKSVAVCGQCHGQRVPKIPDQIADWMDTGPSFRPGDRLLDHVIPVNVDMRPPAGHDQMLYARRFWADGTPRLSAYEFQAMTLSACDDAGKLTCLNCHSMHSGTPANMLSERGASDTACLACHQDLRREPALLAHTQHAVGTPGSACIDCHMPKQVYGVMKIQHSHRITVPDPARSVLSGAPNACLNCHAERSVAWLSQTMLELWKLPVAELSLSDVERESSALRVALFAGDPVQRAVAAEQAGDPAHGRAAKVALQWLPELLLAMEDRYPAVRRFAQQSMISILERAPAQDVRRDWLPLVRQFDFQSDAQTRAALMAQLKAGFDRESLLRLKADIEPLQTLGAARQHEIEIGE